MVAEAEDGEEAVAAAEQTKPDVVLLDLVMPRLSGVEAIGRIRDVSPESRVIVLTSFFDDDKLFPAVRAGAAGYLLKDVQPQELVRAIKTVHDGNALLAPAVTSRRAGRARGDVPERARSADDPDAARARGAGADRPRDAEQGDRARARRVREDGQDPRQQHPRQARPDRPDAGGAVRRARGTRPEATRTNCRWRPAADRAYRLRHEDRDSSPARRAASGSRSPARSPSAAGGS